MNSGWKLNSGERLTLRSIADRVLFENRAEGGTQILASERFAIESLVDLGAVRCKGDWVTLTKETAEFLDIDVGGDLT